MTGREYLVLGYAIALGLMWGYAVVLWLSLRRLSRQKDGAAAPALTSR